MKKKVIITYNWWPDADSSASVNDTHHEALEESAMERVNEMMLEGFTSGELHTTIGETTYQGWWGITTQTL